MRFGNRAVLAVGLSASLISGSVPLFAQIDQGSVTGLVRDANKALVNGATITLVNKETNLTLTRVTDKSGAYSFTPVKIGTYQLTVEAPGFAPQTQDNIRVSVSQVVGLNLNLSVGGLPMPSQLPPIPPCRLRKPQPARPSQPEYSTTFPWMAETMSSRRS